MVRACRPATLGLLAATLVTACQAEDRPPPFVPTDASDEGSLLTDAGSCMVVDLDSGAFCGNQVVPISVSRPNLYFLIDTSGSMSELLPGSSREKLSAARAALAALLEQIGHRVQYGAAAFPAGTDVCGAGREVFETQAGDELDCNGEGGGEVLDGFRDSLFGVDPLGGTPVSSTLEIVAPTLTSLPGETALILVTDGAPNCNPNAMCEADECLLNIEGFSYEDVPCDDDFNCCDPNNTTIDAPLNCVDSDASVRALEMLLEQGVRTFVIGMPGSELFAGVLDRLAVAGGTARASNPMYYEVTDTASLTETLTGIGTSVAIPCEVDLDEAPPDPDLVNVYFDAVVVEASDGDGWSWADETTISLNGEACQELQSGNVLELKVVAGCPTIVR